MNQVRSGVKYRKPRIYLSLESDSDVTVDPRTVRVETFKMVVDP